MNRKSETKEPLDLSKVKWQKPRLEDMPPTWKEWLAKETARDRALVFMLTGLLVVVASAGAYMYADEIGLHWGTDELSEDTLDDSSGSELPEDEIEVLEVDIPQEIRDALPVQDPITPPEIGSEPEPLEPDIDDASGTSVADEPAATPPPSAAASEPPPFAPEPDPSMDGSVDAGGGVSGSAGTAPEGDIEEPLEPTDLP